MDVNVSETIEIKIRQIAESRGEPVADTAGNLLAEKVSSMENGNARGKMTLADLKGMFSGGPGDTAERASEILRAEMGLNSIDPR